MAIEIAALPVFTFIDDAGEETLDLAACGGRIAALGETLRAAVPAGRSERAPRVGIVHRSHPDLVLTWLAALHAGMAPLILQYPTARQTRAYWAESVSHTVDLAGLDLLAVEGGLDLGPLAGTAPAVTIDSAAESATPATTIPDGAILQLSSGTTGFRKAMAYRLADLETHCARYAATLELAGGDRIVSWLPLYHDMGFIACFVLPLLHRVPVVMMDPMDWVARPALLFEAIRRHRATLCWMPNFAFAVMAEQADSEGLDSMRLWVSCSEPVRAGTVRGFLEATGTPDDRFAACYAMAENVFAVSQRRGLKALTVDAREAVSCGPPIAGVDVRIDDGEVLVRSETSLAAYLDSDPMTDADGFYRTGDLGALVDGELAILGRRHDVLIQAGEKLLLSELDETLGALAPESRGRAAALADEDPVLGTEIPLLLLESDRFFDADGTRALADAAAAETGLARFALHRVPPGFITKTSSGKIARPKTLADWRAAAGGADLGQGDPVADLDAIFGALTQDAPAGEMLDSLGLTVLRLILSDAGAALDPAATLADIRASLAAPEATADDDAFSIVCMEDSRQLEWFRDRHVAELSDLLGRPVTFTQLAAPPAAILLSDLVFCDWFLPRAPDPAYRVVNRVLDLVRNAGLLIFGDAAECLFPAAGAYAALSHRFEAAPGADLICTRWQRYTAGHAGLPLVPVPGRALMGAPADRATAALGQYLGCGLLRIAQLPRHRAATGGWEFTAYSDTPWPLADKDALWAALKAQVAALASKPKLAPRRPGPAVDRGDMPHFCAVMIDEDALARVLDRFDRFCLCGPPGSAPGIAERIAARGKHHVPVADPRQAGAVAEAEGLECILMTGGWGRPRTDRPVVPLMSGWDGAVPTLPEGWSADPKDWQTAPDMPRDIFLAG